MMPNQALKIWLIDTENGFSNLMSALCSRLNEKNIGWKISLVLSHNLEEAQCVLDSGQATGIDIVLVGRCGEEEFMRSGELIRNLRSEGSSFKEKPIIGLTVLKNIAREMMAAGCRFTVERKTISDGLLEIMKAGAKNKVSHEDLLSTWQSQKNAA